MATMSSRKTHGVTFGDVRKIMLALPGVTEGTSFGTPAFKVRGKFLSRLREDDVLVLKPVDDIEQQFATTAALRPSSSACRP
ncbi:MAG TPA: hypothetical protein VFY79_03110 [Dehalococcoidia bacterium]|nr:hypothetical protein [Dehalococcoidia bacterium]